MIYDDEDMINQDSMVKFLMGQSIGENSLDEKLVQWKFSRGGIKMGLTLDLTHYCSQCNVAQKNILLVYIHVGNNGSDGW